MSAPANTKGDRIDQVMVGQQVNLAPFTLTSALPAAGWRTVTAVANDAQMVTLTFGDGSTVAGVPAWLVLIGWASA